MARVSEIVIDSNVFFQVIDAKGRGPEYEAWFKDNKLKFCITAISKAEFLIAKGIYETRSDMRKLMQQLERNGLRVLPITPDTSKLLTDLASHRTTPTDYLKHHLADCLIALVAHEHRLPLLTENTRDMPGWMGYKMVDAKSV